VKPENQNIKLYHNIPHDVNVNVVVAVAAITTDDYVPTNAYKECETIW
jgi:hypothetical protein